MTFGVARTLLTLFSFLATGAVRSAVGLFTAMASLPWYWKSAIVNVKGACAKSFVVSSVTNLCIFLFIVGLSKVNLGKCLLTPAV